MLGPLLGSNGTSGSSGNAGTSGSSGTSGRSGSSGTSGSSGAAGAPGTSGTSGSSGTSAAGGGVSLTSNTNNYVVTATGTTPELNGEARLQFNGTTLTQDPGSYISSTALGGIASFTNRTTLASYTNANFTGETIIGYSNDQITEGELIVMKNFDAPNGNMTPSWYRADATGTDTTLAENMLGIALNTAPPGQDVHILLAGFHSNTAGSGSMGNGVPLYMSTTPGAITRVEPTGAGEYVRLVGYVYSQDYPIIRFWPDNTWVRL